MQVTDSSSLTPPQARTVNALQVFKRQYRRAPSIGELAHQIDKSRPAAHEMLERLESKGITFDSVSDREVEQEASAALLGQAIRACSETVFGEVYRYLLEEHESLGAEALRHSATSALMGIVTAHRSDRMMLREGSVRVSVSLEEAPTADFLRLASPSLEALAEEIAGRAPGALGELLDATSRTTFHHAVELIWPTLLHYSPDAPGAESTVHRRKQGVYLTPPWLARRTVKLSLGSWLIRQGASRKAVRRLQEGTARSELSGSAKRKLKRLLRSVTVIDPACGVGTFLYEAFEVILSWRSALTGRPMRQVYAERLVEKQLHGVDRDPLAVALTKAVLWFKKDVHGSSSGNSRAEKTPEKDSPIQCGDSVLGAPFHGTWAEGKTQIGNQRPSGSENLFAEENLRSGTDWNELFPAISKEGGFDLVVGNPPWERIKVLTREFFEVRAPDLAAAPTSSARTKMMKERGKDLKAERDKKKRYADALRDSEIYQYGAVGDLNLYTLFVERSFQIAEQGQGVVCLIIPSGLSTNYTYRHFFGAIREGGHLLKFLDFENREKIFEDVDGRQKFALFVGTNAEVEEDAEYGFFLQTESDLDDPDQRFHIEGEALSRINPNTHTLPVVRSEKDLQILSEMHERVPVLALVEDEEGGKDWYREAVGPQDVDVTYRRLFDMTTDSDLFVEWDREKRRFADHLDSDGFVRTQEGKTEYARVYEGRMIAQYDHRAASSTQRVGKRYRRPAASLETTLEEHRDPEHLVIPRYLINARKLRERLADWQHDWLIGFMDVGSATNRRTMIATALPRSAAGNKVPLFLPEGGAPVAALFLANLNSFAFDYALRQHIGGVSLNKYILEQCPVIPLRQYEECEADFDGVSLQEWIRRRVLRLTYTARDLDGWAEELGHGGGPFEWDPARRRRARVELDALYFALYGLDEPQIRHVMDSFPIVKEEEVSERGSYALVEEIIRCWKDLPI